MDEAFRPALSLGQQLRAVLEEGRRMIAEGIASMGLRLPDGSLRPEFDALPGMDAAGLQAVAHQQPSSGRGNQRKGASP